MRQITNGSPIGIPMALKNNAKTAGKHTLLSMFLQCSLVMLFLQFTGIQAYAQTTLSGVTLTTTAGTMNSTSSCVGSGGYYANGWTGTPTKYWEYTVSTVGYTDITFSTPTSSSGTGPHTGVVYCDFGSGFTLVTGSSYNWTGTGCQSISGLLGGRIDLSAWNSGVEGVANLKVRLYMTGASSSGGTNRVHPNAFEGVAAGCAGTPTGGSISAGQSSFCGSGSTTLTLTGASGGTGITYQWQESPNGSTGWANISGATSTTYNVVNLTTDNYYRVVVTCTTSMSSANSSTQMLDVVAKPAVAPITGYPGNPIFVDAAFTLSSATGGGTWSSNNTSVATVDANGGDVEINFGGEATISYTVLDVISGCDSTVTQDIEAYWDHVLALYAGSNGTSTNVIVHDSVLSNQLTATGFGAATPCGNGGLSGLTVPFADSIFSTSGPYVSYKIVHKNVNEALNLFGIQARVRVSGSGPAFAKLAYRTYNGSWGAWQVDDSVALISGNCGASANVWYWQASQGGPTVTGIKDSLEIAIFPYKPASGSGTFQVNMLEAFGEISSDANCSGTPAGGTIEQIFAEQVCDSGYRTLRLDHPGGVGISYQWQESANGTSGWSDITGAENVYYTTNTLTSATDNFFRVVVSCSHSGMDGNSNVHEVDVVNSPSVSISNERDNIAVGAAWDFDATGVVGGDTVEWFSNYVSTADIDSGTGLIAGTVFPANDVVVTLTVKRNGCYGSAKDTFDIIDSSAIVYYLGDNGTSTAMTALATDAAVSQDLSVNGFGTGTACGKGGVSGLTNAPATFSTSNSEYVSFMVKTDNGAWAAISDIRATLRSSGTGPGSVRFAYRPYVGGSALSWVDNGEDLSVDFDDCGYSMNEISWFDNNSTPQSINPIIPGLSQIDSVEIAVFPFDAASAQGTFQVNSISVRGRVSSPCGNPLVDSLVDLDATPVDINGENLCLNTTHSLRAYPTSYSETYWSIFPGETVPTVAYFSEASIKGATTASFVVGNTQTGLAIYGLAYDGTNTCFALGAATVNLDNTSCLAKPGRPNSVSGIADATGIRFYPNPASSTLNVEANEAVNVSVYSIDGKLLIRQDDAKSINISNLANGMYMIHAYGKDNTLIKTEKFIKQ